MEVEIMEGKKLSPELREKRELNRKLLLKALTDPEFRKTLELDPATALGKKITEINKREIQIVLAMLKGITNQIAATADELLCANTTGHTQSG